MKLQKWTSVFLLLCMLLACAVPAAATGPEAVSAEGVSENSEAQVPEEPSDTADSGERTEGFSVKKFDEPLEIFRTVPRAAMLIELTSGQTLFGMDLYEQNYPASLTKIMTCWLALEYGNLDDILTVSETALQNLHESASTAGLQAGEQMRLEDMLYCMMLQSANESCNVVAEYISGSIEAFVELMNQTAQELGCVGTHFANPHGLHDENHYTTAYDLSLIVRKALENDMFRKITTTAEYTVPATNLSEARKLTTTNRLMLNTASSGFYYSKAAGIKTGFTTPAQCCLISTADDGNMQLLAIILGAPLQWNEDTGDYVYRNFPEAINLFEYGFEHYRISTVMSTLYPVAEVTVNQSAGAQTVALAPTTAVRTLIDADYDPDEIILEIDLPSKSVDAPVEAGQVLGSVTVVYHNMILGTSDLAAITSVSRSEITHKAENTKAFVENNWWKWLLGILLAAIILLVVYVILMQFYRREMRKRKIAARRRALELQRRKERLRDIWPGDME